MDWLQWLQLVGIPIMGILFWKIENNKEKIQELALKMAENYVVKDDLKSFKDEMNKNFDKINEKLDSLCQKKAVKK